MANPVIVVENVGKKFRLGMARHDTLRDRLVSIIRNPFRGAAAPTVANEEFWALQDVSFSVNRGDVLGIIGRNGAGKSTLLKILSRITEPTKGRISIRGRVASLLEVGTGFHPELSGRDNIYLNGAILGMSRSEIRRKFDEIVAFAEVERFLDTPVKHYSSGMYVRLAFAVAAHLEPEILIVDEVLAVGDAQFQKKCLGKMQSVASEEGRTILFVSHNLHAVKQLCTQAILMELGKIAAAGTTTEVVTRYFHKSESEPRVDLACHANRTIGAKPYFQSLQLTDTQGRPNCRFAPGDRVRLIFQVRAHERIIDPRVGIGFTETGGERIFAIATFLSEARMSPIAGHAVIQVEFDLPPVLPAAYQLDLSLTDGTSKRCDEIYSAAAIEVLENNFLRTTHPYFREMGHLMVRSQWSQS